LDTREDTREGIREDMRQDITEDMTAIFVTKRKEVGDMVIERYDADHTTKGGMSGAQGGGG
jgi:hypothetical protein